MMASPSEEGKALFLREVGVSRETQQALEAYVDLVNRWTRRINLVSSGTIAEIWTRHVLDSAQLLEHAPSEARTWLDLGSGGGFPGLVVAALAAERSPKLHFTLVESDERKAVFLRLAITTMKLDCSVLACRAEALAPEHADVVSARALAPLIDLAPVVARHLAPEGTALLPKGRRSGEELRAMLAQWSADVQKVESRTDPSASILVVRRLQRA